MTVSKEALDLATSIALNMADSRRKPLNALAIAIDRLLAERDAAKRVAARAAEWELRATRAEAQLEEQRRKSAAWVKRAFYDGDAG